MRYFVVAGEASGDLHASNLIAEIKRRDENAEFRGLGGDLMHSQGVELVKHYRDMAFMGLIPVLMNLGKVMRNMKDCRLAIADYQPDVVILVDYPSFNLKVAKYVKENLPGTKVYYYIAPKLWAWKEYRLKQIKKYVDRVLSILPFEVEWFGKRGYDVDYVGNPCVDAISQMHHKGETLDEFCTRHNLETKPIIALLAGSRMQEITTSLPKMLEATKGHSDYHIIVAGAPSITSETYDAALKGYPNVKVLRNETYQILQNATAAIVCSGTATLETAIIGTPQVVVYHMAGGKLLHQFLLTFINAAQVSLVNIISGREMVKELIMENFTVEKVREELETILTPSRREAIKHDYDELMTMLGPAGASERAAEMITHSASR